MSTGISYYKDTMMDDSTLKSSKDKYMSKQLSYMYMS